MGQGVGPVNVLVAPDKFAGTMSASVAAEAIATGWLSVFPGDSVRTVPMADGGPGTVSSVAEAIGAEVNYARTTDQRGATVQAPWIALEDGVALVEAASACGLHLVAESERDPLEHDTRGVGFLVGSLGDLGFTRVLVGLGGTGTVDGGVGAAISLGARVVGLEDRVFESLPPRRFGEIASVEGLGDTPAIVLISDVNNPLLGESGAARVFGPQKGATASEVEVLEASMHHLADVVEDCLPGGPWRDLPGAGAAGGLAFGMMAWTSATLVAGARMVAGLVGLEAQIKWSDFVVTGEGSMDSQSLQGKAPMEVLRVASELHKRAGVVVGRIDPALSDQLVNVETLGDPGLLDPVGETVLAGARLATRAHSG